MCGKCGKDIKVILLLNWGEIRFGFVKLAWCATVYVQCMPREGFGEFGSAVCAVYKGIDR